MNSVRRLAHSYKREVLALAVGKRGRRPRGRFPYCTADRQCSGPLLDLTLAELFERGTIDGPGRRQDCGCVA